MGYSGFAGLSFSLKISQFPPAYEASRNSIAASVEEVVSPTAFTQLNYLCLIVNSEVIRIESDFSAIGAFSVRNRI